jgi:transposase
MVALSTFWELPGCEIDHAEMSDGILMIKAHTNYPSAECPVCSHNTSRVHSYYTRMPQDLPIGEWRVRLHLCVRRFRCINATCAKQTFAEQMPEFLPAHAQRTTRFTSTLRDVGLALGGEAGERLCMQLHLPTSATTLLRILRYENDHEKSPVRVLGVDDWAMCKGRTYGSILVDLERHRPIDLLPERDAATLASWLQQHPEVEIVARDRSTEYGRGITAGAPRATQVADRWHLLQNIRQMLERMFTRLHATLRQLPEMSGSETATSSITRTQPFWRVHADETTSQASRAQKKRLYDEVQRLRRCGHNILQIARKLNIARGTVRRYFYAQTFPERAKRRVKASLLDPYLTYLTSRHEAGCENAHQLWREIQTQGYPGTVRQVMRWMQQQRIQPAPTTPRRYLATLRSTQASSSTEYSIPRDAALPSARQLAWLVMQDEQTLAAADTELLRRICLHPDVLTIYPLIQQFVTMVRQHSAVHLDEWLKSCADTSISCLQTFATGIQQDYAAVRAALETPWSNGQTEGQVNRLKLIKRQMYGRANFDLLRLRVLAA